MNELYTAGSLFVVMIAVVVIIERRRNKFWKDFERRMKNDK